MSKKSKTITGVLIILVFLIIGFMSFMDSKIEYVNFAEAKERMRTVEVKGQWLKEKDSKFDGSANTFTFYMKDGDSTLTKVILHQAKPQDFEHTEQIVAIGKWNGTDFEASSVLMKCPSKYVDEKKGVNS